MAPKLNGPIPKEMFFQVAAGVYVLYREGVTSFFELSHRLHGPLECVQEALLTSGNWEEPHLAVFNQMKTYGVHLSFKEALEIDTHRLEAFDEIMDGFFEALHITIDGESELESQNVLYDWERDHQILSDKLLDMIMTQEFSRLVWDDDIAHACVWEEQSKVHPNPIFVWPSENKLDSWDALKSKVKKNPFELFYDEEVKSEDFHDEDRLEKLLTNHSFSYEEIEVLHETTNIFINRVKARKIYHQLHYILFERLETFEMTIGDLYQELGMELKYAAYLTEDRIFKVRSMLLEMIHLEKRTGRIEQLENGHLRLTDLGNAFIEQLSYVALDAVGVWDDMNEILVNIQISGQWGKAIKPYVDDLLFSFDMFANLADWYMEAKNL